MKEINKKNLSVWPGEKERETERESNLCFVCLGRISLGNYRLGLFGGAKAFGRMTHVLKTSLLVIS